jgi:hypothetical protein
VVKTPSVILGGYLEFEVSLTSAASYKQPLVIDFVIHHRKANGETTPKVFKWKTIELPSRKQIKIVKRHPIKLITTRVYYKGEHTIEIKINGESFACANFELIV